VRANETTQASWAELRHPRRPPRPAAPTDRRLDRDHDHVVTLAICIVWGLAVSAAIARGDGNLATVRIAGLVISTLFALNNLK
jgi:hypothetical protein